MNEKKVVVNHSPKLSGTVTVSGAKNAALVQMAATLLTDGISTLKNIPLLQDVHTMITLLRQLGATVTLDAENHCVTIDTSTVDNVCVDADIMAEMRASILVMGPLLSRFGKAEIALPGGCTIGSRPIDYHLNNFIKMGATLSTQGPVIRAEAKKLNAQTFVFDYPSVGATENIMMAATLTPGTTHIINAALEPEVFDLIAMLKTMGAEIDLLHPATIKITGVSQLQPVVHAVMPDRLETGILLLAAAITGGSVYLPNAQPDMLALFLSKLQDMGHTISTDTPQQGIRLQATNTPQAVSIKTGPYPGFPTDLQAPMMVAQCLAQGNSIIEETVFENRLLHARELQNMGATIEIKHNKAFITGGAHLKGCNVTATDIRAASALALAGCAATGETIISGMRHWERGHEHLEEKLAALGANIKIVATSDLGIAQQQQQSEQTI